MDFDTLLKEIKNRFGISDEYHDSQLLGFINDVVCYLQTAGISDDILASEKAYGVIFKGVSDLWNNEPGQGSFSSLFRERAIQLMVESIYEKQQS